MTNTALVNIDHYWKLSTQKRPRGATRRALIQIKRPAPLSTTLNIGAASSGILARQMLAETRIRTSP
jgi:hypothetical protein